MIGSRQECFYQLMTLGIPEHAIPIDQCNNVLLGSHIKWIEDQRQFEWLTKQQQQQQQQNDKDSSQNVVGTDNASMNYGQEIMQQNTLLDLLQATSSHYFGGYQGSIG